MMDIRFCCCIEGVEGIRGQHTASARTNIDNGSSFVFQHGWKKELDHTCCDFNVHTEQVLGEFFIKLMEEARIGIGNANIVDQNPHMNICCSLRNSR